jgi:hypothetical protein
MIYDRWTDEYSSFWTTQAVDLKYAVERKSKTSNIQSAKSASAKTKTQPRTRKTDTGKIPERKRKSKAKK